MKYIGLIPSFSSAIKPAATPGRVGKLTREMMRICANGSKTENVIGTLMNANKTDEILLSLVAPLKSVASVLSVAKTLC